MPSASPVRLGFATAFRQPALVAAEIAWRWSFGTAALALALAGFSGLLAGVTVTDRDLIALGSRNQDLVAAAITHMFQGSAPRVLRALVVLVPALALLWTLAASAGRMATLRVIISNPARPRWGAMLSVHMARAILAVCAAIAGIGTILLAAWISTGVDADGMVRPDETRYLLILLFTLPLLALLWNYLNWMLSLAPVFVVRDGVDAASSVLRGARMFREERSRLLGMAALFAVLRLIAIGALLVASFFAAAVFSSVGFRAMLGALVVVSLGYCMAADFLYIARLAATVEISAGGTPPASTEVPPPPPPPPAETLEASNYSASPA